MLHWYEIEDHQAKWHPDKSPETYISMKWLKAYNIFSWEYCFMKCCINVKYSYLPNQQLGVAQYHIWSKSSPHKPFGMIQQSEKILIRISLWKITHHNLEFYNRDNNGICIALYLTCAQMIKISPRIASPTPPSSSPSGHNLSNL